MGQINFDTNDARLVLNNIIEPRIQLDIYDEQKVQYIDTITGGITGGSLSITADSDIRWTFSLNVIPNGQWDVKVKEYNYIWVDKIGKLRLGLYNRIKDTINWYPMGDYVFTNTSWQYDATNNSLTVSCSDMVSNLNGQRNGQYGALNTIFPAYYDTPYYAKNVTYTSSTYTYSCTISSYTGNYTTGDIFCLKIPTTNGEQTKVKINNRKVLPVYSKVVGYNLEEGTLLPDHKYLFQVCFNPRTNTKYFTMVGECEEEYTAGEGTSSATVYYITYHRIREVVITVLKQLARIKEDDFFVDDIGEYKAMPGYEGWEDYRKETPLWNAVPFDQEFAVGSNIWQIITTFRDLYPNYEAYFDKDGMFVMQMIPDCTNDPISIYNDFVQKVLISENTTMDMSAIRNVNLIYGQSIETDFFANSGVTYSGNTYSATISGYKDGYMNGDKIALRIPSSNTGRCYIKINNYKKIPVYNDNSEKPLYVALQELEEKYAQGKISEETYQRLHRELEKQEVMEADTIYVFKIKKKREDGVDIVRAYLLGHWQATGLCALVDGTTNEEMYTTFDGREVPVYSREYFEDVYNCENVVLVSTPDSPYTCEKIGVRLQVHSGGEFENIDSNVDATERAKWETYKSARLTDNITLSTKICPFINDVNIKVQYQPSDEPIPHEYILKSIAHDFSGGTSSWTLVRFYDYYIPDPSEGDHYIWATVSAYNWSEMKERFTWLQVYEE